MVRIKKLIGIILTVVIAAGLAVVFPVGKTRETYATAEQGKCLGVDVSNHNGKIDWAKAKAGGVEFAIIRIGWGDDLKNQDDPLAEYNMQQCEKLGIPYGVYIYSYATSTAEVDSEIAHTLRMIQGHDPELGIWFDMEDADSYKERHNFNPYTHGAQLTEFCVRYVKGIKAKGYTDVGVYANPDYFNNVLDYKKIAAEGMIWLAFWGNNPERYGFPYDIWQYSSDGSIAGGTGRFDMNWIMADSPLFAKVADIIGKVDEYTRAGDAPLSAGDINGDGTISLSDMTRVKMHILGRLLLKGDAFTCADVNKDNKITLADLTLMKKHILGRIDLTVLEQENPVAGKQSGSEETLNSDTVIPEGNSELPPAEVPEEEIVVDEGTVDETADETVKEETVTEKTETEAAEPGGGVSGEDPESEGPAGLTEK